MMVPPPLFPPGSVMTTRIDWLWVNRRRNQQRGDGAGGLPGRTANAHQNIIHQSQPINKIYILIFFYLFLLLLQSLILF